MKQPADRRFPSQDRSRETVAAIVEAAAQVFERHGYAAATTNRIAERAGVSIGSLYQYFENKDAVFRAVAEAHLAHAAEALAPLIASLEAEPQPEPDEVLASFFQTMLELHADRPALHRFILEGGAPSFHETVVRFEQVLVEQVARYIERLPETVERPSVLARLIVDAVDTLSHRWVAFRLDGVGDDVFVREAVGLLGARLGGID